MKTTLLATLLAATCATAAPSPITINFDDVGNRAGQAIGSSYSVLGVAFQNAVWLTEPFMGPPFLAPDWFDGAGGLGVLTGSYHVAPWAFPGLDTPIVVLFNPPVSQVSIKAFNPGRNGARLRAFDASGVLVGSDQAAGTDYGVGQNFDLAVSDGSLPIRRAVIDQHLWSGIDDAVTFDNLTFTPIPHDLVAVGLAWNYVTGGVDARYRVDGGALTTATTAKLFWASGTSTANILSPTPIRTEPIPVGTGGPGSSGVITFKLLPSAISGAAPGATHILLVVDYDNSVPESNENNNSVAVAAVDIVAVGLTWNNVQGGLDVRYRIIGTPLAGATTAKVFWANGTSIDNILSPTPIFTHTISSGAFGRSGIVHVSGLRLVGPPSGTTHLLLALDRDGLIAEANEDNNVQARADVAVNFSYPSRDASRVSATKTIPVIKDALRQAGQSVAWITSTARTPEEQGDVMFRNKYFKEGADYGPPGQAVLAVYNDWTKTMTRKEIWDNRAAIIAAMVAKIYELGPGNVSRHCGNFSVLNVVDIWQVPFPISGEYLFIQAACADARVSRFLARYHFRCAEALEKSAVFHLEIPQGGGGGSFAAAEESENMDVVGKGRGEMTFSGNSNHVDVSSWFGTASGVVSNGHQVFSFDAHAGDVVSISVNATAVYPGAQATNDDSMLFLFDASGKLLANNDDEFDSGFAAAIEDFTVPQTGTYSVAVTTFSNAPALDGNGIITRWEDQGGSNIEFDVMFSVLSTVPRLFLRSTEAGQVALEWRGTNVLQEASMVTEGWNDVLGATSPTILDASSAQKFYRLRSP